MSEPMAHFSCKYYKLLKALGHDAQDKNSTYLALAQLQYRTSLLVLAPVLDTTSMNIVIHPFLRL